MSESTGCVYVKSGPSFKRQLCVFCQWKLRCRSRQLDSGFPHQQRREEDQCWPRLRLTVLEGLADAHLADEVGPSTEARASWLPGLAQDYFTCEGHARCVSHVAQGR